MIITELQELEFNTTNVPTDTTAVWDIDTGYALDTIRKVDKKLYQALGVIDPLCEYIYNNTDPLNTHYTTVANTTLAVADNTIVACTQTTTIVYVVDTNIYYQYTAVSANVDFTNTDFATSPNFSSVTNYRHDIFEPSVTPLKWKDKGFTNKYKMLDTSLSSQTVVSGNMEMSFNTTKIDKIYLFNLVGDTVTIKVTDVDTATVVYDVTTNLLDKNQGADWWGYIYDDYTVLTKINSTVDISFNMLVEITIFSSLEAKCGFLGMGRSEDIGFTLFGSGAGIIDFSKKEVNSNGDTFLSVGKFKSTNSLTVDVLAGQTDSVVDRLTSLRAVPVVYEGSEIYTSTLIFGVYNDWDVIFSTPSITRLNINLESLT